MSFSCSRLLLLGIWILATGSIHGQNTNPSVEQSRLYPRTIPPTSGNITPDGIGLPEGERTTSEDESFGAQQILKTEEKIPDLTISGNASVYYTSNVALTHHGEKSDGFFVGDTAISWSPRINPQLQFQIGGGAALFRYFETNELDFESLGAGAGLVWTPQNLWGLAFAVRYDFTELLDSDSNEILEDHEFSLAVQKLLVLGRSHALSFGLLGSAGISDPFDEQRDQLGFAVGYHLQLTRQLGSDFGYRHSWYFYNDSGRADLNQVVSLGLHYNITPWATVSALISGAFNCSDHSAFSYNAFSSGGGINLTIRF